MPGTTVAEAHSPGGCRAKIQVLPGLVPPEASLPGVWTAVLSPCPHTMVSPCMCVPISPSYKDTSPKGRSLISVTSFYLSHLCKCPASKCSHTLRSWGSELQHTNFEDMLHPKTKPLPPSVSTWSCTMICDDNPTPGRNQIVEGPQ